MKLFMNTTSPYARLIQVLLLETGLEAELAMLDPWNESAALLAANPASKIPALRLDDGTHLTESACIADYLIHLSGKTALSPLSHADGPQRLAILGQARAAMDCAFGSVIQQRFAPISPLVERWRGALPRIAARLDGLYARRPQIGEPDLADLTAALAFDYADFRLPEVGWREAAPHLAERVAQLVQRPSLVATRPA